MAQHVQETNIVERRLRLVYDALEAGNYKKALQEAEKVMKKNSSLQCAKALKALALLRLGREDESQVIVNALADDKPYDDATLTVMSHCYRETEQLHKICEIYSQAAKVKPGNEELLSHLFMSYIRINDYKSQQNVALQLYKLKPKNPYYFWAVMSVVLQALRGPDSKNPDKSKLLLALAQRMVDKFINEDKLDAEQEVQLYLNILQYQDKFNEALEFYDGGVCKKLYPGAPITIKMDLLKKVNKWADLNILLKNLLNENQDRWDYYKEYIKSCFELHSMNDKTDGADYTIDMCHEFICQIIEQGNRVRGPYLARLELHRLMKEKNMCPEDMLGDYLELLVEYFRFFGDKPCCANDLKLFLEYLEYYRRPGLASRLLQDCGINSTTLPQSKEQMQKHICALQISRYCGGMELGIKHLSALYTVLSLHYEHGMTAFGNNLLPTDIGPSDPYALLAVHVMYDLSVKQNSSERLLEGVCLLTYLLSNSPSNFHAKLLLLQIYHILGIGFGAHKQYESLDIKYVQLDSMGYLHCAQLPSIGIPSIAKPLYDQTLRFFTMSYKDSVEYLEMSYKFGSFIKLQEFIDFRERLSNSIHYTTISIETLLLELICLNGINTLQQNLLIYKHMNIEPHVDSIDWKDLQDNRDLSVIVSWDPKPAQTNNMNYLNNTNSNENCNNTNLNSESDTMEPSIATTMVNNDFLAAANQAANTVYVAGTTPIETINTINENEETFKNDVQLLRIRSLLLRLVSSTIDLIITKNNDNINMKEETKEINIDNFINDFDDDNDDGVDNDNCCDDNSIINDNDYNDDHIKDDINIDDNEVVKKLKINKLLLRKWINFYKKNKNGKLLLNNKKLFLNKYLVNILLSRLNIIQIIPYNKIFINLTKFIYYIFLSNNCSKIISNKLQNVKVKLITSINNIKTILCDNIYNYNKLNDLLWERRNVVQYVVYCIEILSLCTFVLTTCYERYTQSSQQSTTNKKGKKNNHQHNQNNEKKSVVNNLHDCLPDKECLILIVDVIKELRACLFSCEEALDSWLCPSLSNDLIKSLSSLSLNTNIETNVNSIIKESHQMTCKEMKQIIKDKIKMTNKSIQMVIA